MHTAAVYLAPILGAEKSKVPFYVAGGLLVVWALTVSLGLGLRKPDFPGSLSGQRAVMAVTGVLVLAAVLTAVITASPPAKAVAVKPVVYAPPTAEVPGAPPSAAATSPARAPSTSAGSTPAAAPTRAGTSSSLTLAANPSGLLSYNTKALSAKAGNVTITMANMSPLEHNVTIAEGSTILGATPTFKGGSRTLTLKLKPGTYTFYCSVPGHRQAGMEGTLSVS